MSAVLSVCRLQPLTINSEIDAAADSLSCARPPGGPSLPSPGPRSGLLPFCAPREQVSPQFLPPLPPPSSPLADFGMAFLLTPRYVSEPETASCLPPSQYLGPSDSPSSKGPSPFTIRLLSPGTLAELVQGPGHHGPSPCAVIARTIGQQRIVIEAGQPFLAPSAHQATSLSKHRGWFTSSLRPAGE